MAHRPMPAAPPTKAQAPWHQLQDPPAKSCCPTGLGPGARHQRHRPRPAAPPAKTHPAKACGTPGQCPGSSTLDGPQPTRQVACQGISPLIRHPAAHAPGKANLACWTTSPGPSRPAPHFKAPPAATQASSQTSSPKRPAPPAPGPLPIAYRPAPDGQDSSRIGRRPPNLVTHMSTKQSRIQ